MASYKILYIEDNNDNFRLVKRILSRWDFIVDRAETAVSGIKMAQNCNYDLILTDILLPDNTIQEAHSQLLEPIRQQIGPDVPLIALTAHAFPFEKDFLLANGCNYFVAKPININEFQKLVTNLLQLDSQDSDI
jgi:CheY-like chemotaxis protein